MTRTVDVPSLNVPPTVNDLGSSQRTRLMRSTRKLGDVLGTTPHLIEYASDSGTATPRAATKSGPRLNVAAPKLSLAGPQATKTGNSQKKLRSAKKRQRRQFQIFQNSAALHSSSGSSFESFKAGAESPISSSAPATPTALATITTTTTNTFHLMNIPSLGPRPRKQTPAMLKLHAVPRSFSMIDSPDFMLSPIDVPTPTSSTFSIMQVDTTSSVANVIARRRKMAKLTRTLGENVPAELVFPRSAPASPSLEPLRRSTDIPSFGAISSLTRRKNSLKRMKAAAFQPLNIFGGSSSDSKADTTAAAQSTSKAASHFNHYSHKRVSDQSVYSTFGNPELETPPTSISSADAIDSHEDVGIIPARRSGIDHFDLYTQPAQPWTGVSHVRSPSEPMASTLGVPTSTQGRSARRVSSMLFASKKSSGGSSHSSDSGHSNGNSSTTSGGGGHYRTGTAAVANNSSGHYRKSAHVALEAQNRQSRWEGTWNRNDMTEVRQGLRALRA